MAIQLSKQHHPDLIVMDVHMPMTHGLKALEFLRRIPATEKTPVIFLTGARTEDVAAAIGQAPRVAHLKKPVNIDELLSLISKFLQDYPNPI